MGKRLTIKGLEQTKTVNDNHFWLPSQDVVVTSAIVIGWCDRSFSRLRRHWAGGRNRVFIGLRNLIKMEADRTVAPEPGNQKGLH